MFATYFASVKKRWNAECMVRHLEAAPLWGQNVCDIFCISEKSSFTQVLDCKWMALVSVSRLQSSTWVKELFSLMQNMSQTFCPQSGAASRRSPCTTRSIFFPLMQNMSQTFCPQSRAPSRRSPCPTRSIFFPLLQNIYHKLSP